MDDAQPRAGAVAIAGGRILALGTDAEVRAHETAATRVIDLDGRTVVPGLADNHFHSAGGGTGVDLSGARTLDGQTDQALAAVGINAQIRTVEGTIGHRRTLVVGDFNMNPFEPGLVSFDCFHAVMSRTTAQRRSRKIGGQEHFFFYNPMWNHFGDHPPSPPGSYYRTGSGRTEYFWHSFDQVLLRPDLLDCFRDDGLEVVTRIGELSLVKENGIPDRTTGSDHLPLLLELSIERETEYGRTESVAEAEG